jgi:hypothetical protein
MSLLLLFNSPPYHHALLAAARHNHNLNQHEIATVTAHMACEVLAEQVMSAGFRARGIEPLEDPVTDLLPSINLANERVRNVYVALTNDQIQAAQFWQSFTESSSRRNGAVHRGRRISADEARITCETAEAMLRHLEAVLQRLSSVP